MKTLARRLARLEAWLPPPSPEFQQLLQRTAPLFHHWDCLVTAALPLMTADEQARVYQAVKQLHEGAGKDPYGLWFASLCVGLSRLPPLDPQVMKNLLVIRVFNDIPGAFICTDCGLEHPFRRWPRATDSHLWLVTTGDNIAVEPAEFFAACPHCGSTNKEIAGSDVVEQRDYPWKHLDGYVAPLPPTAPGELA